MRERTIERAARNAARRARVAIEEDLDRLRLDAGWSEAALADAAGVDRAFTHRLLRHEARPSVETYARLTAALDADLGLRAFANTGPRVRDRLAAPMLELLLGTIHPRFGPFVEVGVRRPARGWIDAVLHDAAASLAIATELQSALRRLEQLIRWQGMKAEALPSWDRWAALGEPAISRLLVVRRTRATRAVAQEFSAQLRVAYPAHPDDAIASLTGTAPWPGAALVWVTVDARGARWASGR